MSETVESSEEAPVIVCLNYCMPDPETGVCLTCGRPPVPVTGVELNLGTGGGLLEKMLKGSLGGMPKREGESGG